jgi:hypothetical protein
MIYAKTKTKNNPANPAANLRAVGECSGRT